MRNKKRTNYEIVIRAMRFGIGVKLFPNIAELYMSECGKIGIKATNDKGEEFILPAFIEPCELSKAYDRLSDDAIWGLVADTALNTKKEITCHK